MTVSFMMMTLYTTGFRGIGWYKSVCPTMNCKGKAMGRSAAMIWYEVKAREKGDSNAKQSETSLDALISIDNKILHDW